MFGLISFIVITFIGWLFGRMNERNHFKRIAASEADLSDIFVTNLGRDIVPLGTPAPGGVTLVTGSVTVANDAFKVFIGGILMLFGGRLRMYESLLERARREAIIRMKTHARAMGASRIIGVRLETSAITGQKHGTVGGVEVIAYGTALIA